MNFETKRLIIGLTFIICWVLSILVPFAITVGLIWVIAHFALKFW